MIIRRVLRDKKVEGLQEEKMRDSIFGCLFIFIVFFAIWFTLGILDSLGILDIF